MYIKDIKTKQIHEVSQVDSNIFFESHERPNDLVNINVWYCDGSGWNGRKSGYAFGIKDSIQVIWNTKINTNNECEYMGFIEALKVSSMYDHIKTDSQLIVNQVSMNWKCNKQELILFRDQAIRLIKQKQLTFEWIPRGENLAGKEIETEQ